MDGTNEEAEETMFIAALSKLRKASSKYWCAELWNDVYCIAHIGEDNQDTARYYFLVFTQGEDHISIEG